MSPWGSSAWKQGPGKVMVTTAGCGRVTVFESVRSCSPSRSTDRTECSRIMALDQSKRHCLCKSKSLVNCNLLLGGVWDWNKMVWRKRPVVRLCSVHCKQHSLPWRSGGLDNPMAKLGTAEAWGGWGVCKRISKQQSWGRSWRWPSYRMQSDRVPTYFGEDGEFNAMNRVYMLQVPAFLTLSCFIPAGFTHSTHHPVLSLILSLLPCCPRGV